MAVYTHMSSEAIAHLLAAYDVGTLTSAKGIAEGVENSNFLIDTDRDRYILTVYEKRMRKEDLPFFLRLLDHLAERGLPVPPAIADRQGHQIQAVDDKPACLITFLPGVSPDQPSAVQARAVGSAMGRLHKALEDFAEDHPNSLSLPAWHDLASRCGPQLETIDASLPALVAEELAFLDQNWPSDLPLSIIHADLFPDNVLMLDDEVTGMIDFYFACRDFRAFDLAVSHSAWCFAPDGTSFSPDNSAALIAGYQQQNPLGRDEFEALAVLVRGAALRFLLTRCWDWLNTPGDALVTRKDPMAFASRLLFYRSAGQELFE
jgi:homoserine kinase type II